MKKGLTLLLLLFLGISLFSQNNKELRGTVVDATTKTPIDGISVAFNDLKQSAMTNQEGVFVFYNIPPGDHVLFVSSPLIEDLFLPIKVSDVAVVDLGTIEVERSQSKRFAQDNTLAVITLDESMVDSEADYSTQSISTLALMSNDPYLSIISYPFSSVRFRPRGYHNKFERTYLSGVEFNDQIRGVFNYSMLGAMNDVTRNGNTINFMQPGSFSFGSIAGAQDINLRAANYTKGNKVTLSYTNRNYYLRGMASHSTGLMDNGWAFTGLVGFRYADEGAVEGTFYNNISYFFAMEKQWDEGKHSFSFTTFGSPVQRGQQSASVREAYDLVGNNQYNTYWGFQDGKKRNSRIVTAYDPTAIFSYVIKFNRNTTLTNGLSLRYSRYGTTALSWFKNAQDPRPDYYRYLPSYIYSGSGYSDAFFQVLNSWTENNTDVTQINWQRLYEENYLDKMDGDPTARYLVEERRSDQLEGSLNSTLESKLTDNITFNGGVGFRSTKGMIFNTINDLLGADYHIDIDKFGERDFLGDGKQNDLNNPNRIVREGDRYAYDYDLYVNSANIWGQNQHEYAKINVYYGLRLAYTEYVRDGNMRNGKNPNNSYGKGDKHTFVDPSFKAGLIYKIDGRNFISLNGGFQTNAPLAYDAYISPRVSDKAMPDLKSEKIWNVDLGYTFSLPTLSGRISVFQTNFYDQMKKVSYYHDSYSTYVHHIMKDINTVHRGVELGLIWKATKDLTFNFGGTLGEYYYANRPNGIISYENNMEPDSYPETVYIKNFRVGGTPQTAGTIGVDYFYDYWFFGANLNGFAHSYLDPSPIQRTSSVIDLIPMDEKEDYLNYIQQLTSQSKLNGGMTLDISIGKLLFFRSGKSMSINLSVNNVLNNRTLQTGGYEQGRIPLTGSGDDRVVDTSNLNKFPPKYYFMQGINCYLNVNYKF